MNASLYTHALTCLLLWLHPDPRNVARIAELQTIAVDIARSGGDETDAEILAAVTIHETTAHVWEWSDGKRRVVVGLRGARGPFQIEDGPPDATEALRRVRWSFDACGVGDMSLYAGCGRCGACPEIAASLLDPTLQRR